MSKKVVKALIFDIIIVFLLLVLYEFLKSGCAKAGAFISIALMVVFLILITAVILIFIFYWWCDVKWTAIKKKLTNLKGD